MWSTVLGRSSLIDERSSPFKNSIPNFEIAPCPVIPSHSASRSVHSANSSCRDEFRRTGARHRSNSLKLLHSGAISGFSRSKSRVRARTRAAFTRSSSGPSAATFFASARPTNPLTREVINHCEASCCQRSDGDCMSQISNLLLGSIRSSASTLTSEAK